MPSSLTAPAQPSTLPFNVPGPSVSTPWGKTAQVIQFVQDSLGYTSKLFATYGPVVAMRQGGKTRLYSSREHCPGTVFVYGPEIIRQIATQNEVYHKCPLTGPLYRLRDRSDRTRPLNNFLVGLFGINDDQHLQSRKLMMPAFHKQRLQTYLQDMVAIADAELSLLSPGQTYDMAKVMQRLTLRIATKTLFGEDYRNPSDGTTGLVREAIRLQSHILTKLLPFDLPGLTFHQFLNTVKRYEEQMGAIIAAKQAKGEDDNDSSDILSMLIQARDEESGLQLSEDELLGHVGVLFVAGHETSANALTWTLFLLSQHPQIAQTLQDELNRALGGNPPTLEQLQALPYLEKVVKESLRIISPVPWNGRVTSQETELGGYRLPAGTEVFVSLYHTHHMATIYDEPERFNPDRWDQINPNSYEYNPFSAGPRICIGAAFAMMEIKVVLARLMQRFRLEFEATQRLDRSGVIVTAPKQGMPMRVHSSDGSFAKSTQPVQGNIREMVQL